MGHMKAIGDKLRHCNDGCSLTNFDKTVDKIFGDKPNVAIIVKKIMRNTFSRLQNLRKFTANRLLRYLHAEDNDEPQMSSNHWPGNDGISTHAHGNS